MGIFAPADTPGDLIAKISAAAAGIEVRYQTPEALAALVERETAFLGKTIAAEKITAD